MTFSMSELHNTSTRIVMEEVTQMWKTKIIICLLLQEEEEDTSLSAKEVEEEKKRAKELQAKYVKS